jgi:L,D-peptidoglycan transpeptidase YkuD (ErfK/YbiS/YcfS/YnhG family)
MMTVRLRSVGVGVTIAAGLMQSCQPACAPTPAPPASVCTPPAGVPASARQVVVVTAAGHTADVDLLVHEDAGWQCAAMDMPGRVGRNGVRDLAARRSGDGTTPAGTFGLGTMTAPNGDTFQFFGNGARPSGLRGGWHQVQPNDCWGATPGTPDYNALVSRAASACRAPDEYLANLPTTYSQAALIDANMGPSRSGDHPSEPPLAAAIFLHHHTYRNGVAAATSGCVSLNATNLARVLPRLVPGEAWFVIR